MSIACDNIEVAKFEKLRIIDGDYIKIYDDDATIRVMPLHSPIIQEVEPESEYAERVVKFVAQRAVVIVDYLDIDLMLHTLTINLIARDEDESTMYYRAYAVPDIGVVRQSYRGPLPRRTASRHSHRMLGAP